MPIITHKNEVVEIYREAEKNRWVLPCFCTENLTTTEAILAAAKEYEAANGITGLPVTIAITCRYDHRSQAANYTNTKRWDIGLKIFLEDLRILTEKGAPYEDLRVLIHLDHIQFDTDSELLSWDMGAFSSIMYDASRLSFDENMRLTAKFVAENRHSILIEGACDEIVDAGGNEKSELTTPEKAELFFEKTSADLIVANLGTEHRASAKDLIYHSALAKKIKDRIGTRIVLHGASSVPGDQLSSLIEDGVCKVNLWAALERDSTPVLFRDMVSNAVKVAGNITVAELVKEGLLTEKCINRGKATLSHFTTMYRQDVVFNEMKKIVRYYLDLWYK